MCSFFRHYKLYRYVFTAEQRHTIATEPATSQAFEVASVPPPLAQAEEQLAEQPIELADEAVQEIVEQTGEDPVTIREAFAAAVKDELRNLQDAMREQEAALAGKVQELSQAVSGE